MAGVLRILVVEDDRDLGPAVVDWLEEDGHAVELAPSAAAALSIAAASQPHAVLLDLGLPDLDGFELAKSLRAGVLHADATIIAITGRDDVRLDAADAAGIDLLLQKPVDAQYLGGLVRYVAGRRRDQLRKRPPVEGVHYMRSRRPPR